jgi:hypothetical protein
VQPPAPADDTLPASQGTGAVAPATQAKPSGHSAQSSTDVAFAVPFHVPTGHSSAADARASQYAPAGHASHAVAFGAS